MHYETVPSRLKGSVRELAEPSRYGGSAPCDWGRAPHRRRLGLGRVQRSSDGRRGGARVRGVRGSGGVGNHPPRGGHRDRRGLGSGRTPHDLSDDRSGRSPTLDSTGRGPANGRRADRRGSVPVLPNPQSGDFGEMFGVRRSALERLRGPDLGRSRSRASYRGTAGRVSE